MKSRKILLPLAALFVMTIAACNSGGVTPSYTVTFDSKGGSQVESQTVEKGKTATKPTNPTKANLTFGEWYKEEAYTNAFDFTSPIEADLTLYARWVCTVTFNSKGGSAVRKQEVNEGGKATKPTDPTKSGYDFVNWYSDEGYETVFDFANTTLTGNITLYAKWTLSVSPVLLSSVNPNVIDGGDTEFSVWTPSSNFVGHNIQGWATGNTFE